MSLYPLRNTRVQYWFPLLAWSLAIFLFSTDSFSSSHTSRFIVPILKFLFPFLSVEQVEFWHGAIRKAGHVTEYFVLGVLAWRTFKLYWTAATKAKILAAAFVIAFAFSDEFHQSFVSSRGSSLRDVGFDCIGGLIALMLARGYRREDRPIPSHPVL